MKYTVSLILVSCAVGVISAYGELPRRPTPQQLYEMIGNPNVDSYDQAVAYSQLADYRSRREEEPEADYYLAECYVSGKTGDGGPLVARNEKGFPPNRPEAYKLALPLYMRAAEHGHIPSLLKLAGLYEEGKYVPHLPGLIGATLET